MRVAFVPALFVLCVLTGPSHAVDVKKVRPAAVAPAEQAWVTDAVHSLGFTVGKVFATGPGHWEVQVEAYDPARAAAALRGTVRGPAMQFSKPGLQAMSVRGGRGGGVRPGSGPLATDEDGSQTGSGQGGEMPMTRSALVTAVAARLASMTAEAVPPEVATIQGQTTQVVVRPAAAPCG